MACSVVRVPGSAAQAPSAQTRKIANADNVRFIEKKLNHTANCRRQIPLAARIEEKSIELERGAQKKSSRTRQTRADSSCRCFSDMLPLSYNRNDRIPTRILYILVVHFIEVETRQARKHDILGSCRIPFPAVRPGRGCRSECGNEASPQIEGCFVWSVQGRFLRGTSLS